MVLLKSMPELLCPWCTEQGGLGIWEALQAQPVGSFSLPGAQMKVSASVIVTLRCTICKWQVEGRIDGTDAVFPDPHVQKGEL